MPLPPTNVPVATATPLPTPVDATQEPTAPPVMTIVVAPGDTLAIIAARYGVSIDAILALNALDDPNFIYPGELLLIPTAASAP
jgi:LysM repeat protein